MQPMAKYFYRKKMAVYAILNFVHSSKRLKPAIFIQNQRHFFTSLHAAASRITKQQRKDCLFTLAPQRCYSEGMKNETQFGRFECEGGFGHMKNKKWMRTLLAAALAVSLTAGCASSGTGTSGDTTASKTESTGADETPEAAASDTIQKIADGDVTWTIFRGSHTAIGTQIDDWSETLLYQEMEKRTGVHLECITPVLGQEQTQFQLLVSSGDLPDFIEGTQGYVGGGEAMINDGLIVDLAQHLDQMPNFKKQLEMSDLRKKEVYTDTGKVSHFPGFIENDEESEIFVGILIRKDLLDEVNMEIPVTYDDWYEVLTAFKEQCGISKPLVPGPEMFGQNNMWSSGYGFGYVDYFGTNVPFYQKDGKVRYAPLDDTELFRSYLEMMAKWYSEGLIDPDFQTVTDINAQISTYSSLDCGACITPYSLAPVLAGIGQASKPDFEYVCAPIPVLKEGDTPHMYAATSQINLNDVAINVNCENLDLALSYWDQYYTEEASLLSCWGVEGETFEYDENGDPQWLDVMTHNPDGYNFLSMRIATLSQCTPGVGERRSDMVDEFSIACDALYRENGDNDYRISSNLTLTEEENEIYNMYMTDILTYTQEQCVRYMTGQESFDTFDSFIEQIRSMNVEKVMEVYQNALDRYNAR